MEACLNMPAISSSLKHNVKGIAKYAAKSMMEEAVGCIVEETNVLPTYKKEIWIGNYYVKITIKPTIV